MESILASPTFVIHLPRCKDRLPYVTKQLKEAGYTNLSIFNATDGLDPSSVNESIRMFHSPRLDSIKPGALGCLLSHMRLLNYIIEQNIPIANIFEDDIYFHPNWNSLSKHYYGLTPKDYEILFIGNQLYGVDELSEITKEYWYCLHAYIITLEGAKKLKNMIIQYSLENRLCEIDRIIMHVLHYTKSKHIPPPFVSYSWNGMKYPCEHNTTKQIHNRNTGLVFQNITFVSEIDNTTLTEIKSKNKKKMIMI